MVEINDVLKRIEKYRYLELSIYEIEKHKDDIDKSIHGEFDGEKSLLTLFPPRKFEPFDLTWNGMTSASDVLQATAEAYAEQMIVCMKASFDDYINENHKGKMNEVYNNIKMKFPSVEITLPNEVRIHVLDLIKIVRDSIAHGHKDQKLTQLIEETPRHFF